ncbi:ribonuclease P protein component [Alkalilimnicola ehrlichii MLHE-1]|uniref:Ribonuclease P protein component n=1 Tax=Alkalilimnicola ehrlichii (strain ATCC BAA-1101 / DSM 17681 / MLHE-1) TaxID=187272 RepID=Q0A4L4_ALKEH|nr:ribonuclease P protein component [Alkalilimnicola ehrlichii]ABI58223.1 ribonuclease P protein component [Alkalilimnicola ehrlichii MLHE-1]
MAARGHGPCAFPRRRRLTRPQDYRRVFSGAQKAADRYFTVLARGNDQVGPRLGLAISRRVAPRAVDRNRLKRIAREVFRQRQAALGQRDYVVLARPAARTASKARLHRSLGRLYDRLNDGNRH